MIDTLFAVRLVLSFIIGGLFIAAVTRASELLGPKVGGVVSAIPTTGLIGMIFLGLSEGSTALSKAAPAMLIGFGASNLLLATYVYLRQKDRSVPSALLLSVCLWLVLMIIIGKLHIHSLPLAVALFLGCFGLSAAYLKNVKETTAVRKPATLQILLTRAVFAGIIVASVILLARLIGPIWGGVAAAFPALYLSTIVILERHQGKDFTASVLKHIPLGSFGLATFAFGITYFAGRFSLAPTIVVSTALSLVVSTLVYQYKTRFA